jgi:ribosomal protein S18 acetylase RimI-like enzyme
MILEIDIRSAADEVHAVAQAAYRLEAERIGCADFPPLRETAEELKQSRDRFLVNQSSDAITGMLSFDTQMSGRVIITRLVVSPANLRRGVATALLAWMEEQFGCAAAIWVTTAEANTAAIAVYEGMGYQCVNRRHAAEGIALVDFVRPSSFGMTRG